jgi:hypothetical protein
MFTESAEFYDAIYSFKDYAAEAAQIAALVRASCPQARSVLDVACDRNLRTGIRDPRFRSVP